MNKVRPAGEFMEDTQAPCRPACSHVSLLEQVTDDGKVTDIAVQAIQFGTYVRYCGINF